MPQEGGLVVVLRSVRAGRRQRLTADANVRIERVVARHQLSEEEGAVLRALVSASASDGGWRWAGAAEVADHALSTAGVHGVLERLAGEGHVLSRLRPPLYAPLGPDDDRPVR